MAYEEYNQFNEPATSDISLKDALYNILNGFQSEKQWRETGEGINRVRQALPGVAESVGRGAIAAVPGSIGDVSEFARTYAPEVMEKKFGKERFFPTTREILDYVPRITPTHEGATTLEDVGSAISPGIGGVAKDVALLGKGLPVGLSIKDVTKITPTLAEYEAMVGKGKMRQARTFDQDLKDTLSGKVPGNKFDIPMEHSVDYESGDFTKRLEKAGLHVYDDKYGTIFVGKTPKDLEIIKNAETPIEHGLSYGYTPEDIAKFYTNRRGGRSDIGYSEYIDDLKHVQNKYPQNEPKPFSVSTRVPTAVKAEEDALKQSLLSDYKAYRSDQKAFLHNTELVGSYPNLALKSKNADVNAEKFVEHLKDNLLYLHDKVPADTREVSRQWYEGANKMANKLANEYGITEPQSSGMLAVLSPQQDWYVNLSLGERVAATMAHKQGFKWDSAMSDVANEIYGKPQYKPILDAIQGKRLEELKDPVEKAMWIRTHDEAHNPREHFVTTPKGEIAGVRMTDKGIPYKTGWGSNNEIAKAVSIFDNGSRENISQKLGEYHKVRNFYNNIYDPFNPEGHTTIDTHAVAAGLLRPLSAKAREVGHNFGNNFPGEVGPKNSAFTGKKGTYGLYHEAYQRAAKERDLLPREMQSITWEAVKGLFNEKFKTPENAEFINNIWKQHKSGKISIDEARKQIVEKAGGIDAPEWKD